MFCSTISIWYSENIFLVNCSPETVSFFGKTMWLTHSRLLFELHFCVVKGYRETGLFLMFRIFHCCVIWACPWATMSSFIHYFHFRKKDLELNSNLQAVNIFKYYLNAHVKEHTHMQVYTTGWSHICIRVQNYIIWNSCKHKNEALPVITVMNCWSIWWIRSSCDRVWSVHHITLTKFSFLWAQISEEN